LGCPTKEDDESAALEKRLRSHPPGEGNYGQRLNWGHELDQAMSADELAEIAIRYLSGEGIDLENLEMLKVYTDLDYYGILVERVDDR
jgi:hypothetical protein